MRLVLRNDMPAVCGAARAYSVGRDPLELALFQYELAQVAESWDGTDPSPILLAAEDLCGHLPGRDGITSYAAAPDLLRTLADTLVLVHPGAVVTVFLSTRARRPWLRSCHAQHLVASRMTMKAGDYISAFRPSGRLRETVAKITEAVAPHRVLEMALEDSRGLPLGPAEPLLDLLEVPPDVRARMVLHPDTNAAPPQAVLDGLLALNRGALDEDALKEAKRRLCRGAP